MIFEHTRHSFLERRAFSQIDRALFTCQYLFYIGIKRLSITPQEIYDAVNNH